MTLADHITRSLLLFPLLFKSENPQHSKDLILEQTFMTNGNGMEWYDGYLADVYDREPLPYGQEWVMTEADKARIETSNKEYSKYKPEEPKYSPYPLSSYSDILNLPANIHLDWLEGAEMAINRAITYYRTKEEYVKHSYYPTLHKMKEYEDERSGVEKVDIFSLYQKEDQKEALLAMIMAARNKPKFEPQPETVEKLVNEFDTYRRGQLRLLNKAKKNCQRLKEAMK